VRTARRARTRSTRRGRCAGTTLWTSSSCVCFISRGTVAPSQQSSVFIYPLKGVTNPLWSTMRMPEISAFVDTSFRVLGWEAPIFSGRVVPKLQTHRTWPQVYPVGMSEPRCTVERVEAGNTSGTARLVMKQPCLHNLINRDWQPVGLTVGAAQPRPPLFCVGNLCE
jgi:hypothetical protein